MSTDKSTERAEFEAWMRDVAKITTTSADPYPAGLTRDYWRVWQAARRAAPAADALALAVRFHETYERLAPSFGYETRTETRAFDPESPNGRLMVAVCAALSQPATERKPLTHEQIDDLSREMVKGGKSVNWLARAIEAAHGIVADAKAQEGSE